MNIKKISKNNLIDLHELIIILFILFIQNLSAQPPSVQWIQKYGSSLNNIDEAYALILDDSANVYVTGKVANTGGSDFGTVKYDANGILQWDTTYNGPANSGDESYFIAIDDSGNVYVAGQSRGIGSGYDYCTIKYNSSGIPQWIARYNGTGNYDDIPTYLVVKNGYVYVTGYSVDTNFNYSFATIKYNAIGTVQWMRRYQGALNLEASPYALVVDDSNNVYVGGEESLTLSDGNYALIKYDSTGNVKWIANYQGIGYDYDQIIGIAVNDSGYVYVTGMSARNPSPGNIGIATIKYNPIGDSVWVRRYDVGFDAVPIAFASDKKENLYITGWTNNVNGIDSINYITMKYDSSGLLKWVAIYNGSGNLDDQANAVAVDNYGNVYVTGYITSSAGNRDYATIKYDSLGNQKWTISYNGLYNSSDIAYDIAIDTFGNVYVTGFGWEAGPFDAQFVTIKYSQLTLVEEANVNNNNLTIFPNPFTTQANLVLPEEIEINGKTMLVIYDVMGNETTRVTITSYRALINRDNLPSGMYFCKVVSDNTVIATGKFIVQ